ncbi:MAG TPA: hypothetical protein VLF89_02405 [Candidatus Saccharimonadales bacterium]|nr:hypothetical protein [Candidatus Saccharimonadales bacterium]
MKLHNVRNMNEEQQCQTCYRIACRKCEWIASEEEVVLIQKETLTSCPLCGWKPGDDIY